MTERADLRELIVISDHPYSINASQALAVIDNKYISNIMTCADCVHIRADPWFIPGQVKVVNDTCIVCEYCYRHNMIFCSFWPERDNDLLEGVLKSSKCAVDAAKSMVVDEKKKQPKEIIILTDGAKRITERKECKMHLQ